MKNLDRLFQEADPSRTPIPESITGAQDDLLTQIMESPQGLESTSKVSTRGNFLGRSPIAFGLALGGLIIVIAGAAVFGFLAARDSSPSFGDSVWAEQRETMGDWPWYESEAALVNMADAVVSGVVVETSERGIEDIGYQIITVEVQSSAKGELEVGQEIDVAYWVINSPSEPPQLNVGDMAVMFLILGEVEGNQIGFPLNPDQGSYRILDDQIVVGAPKNPIPLSAELLAELGIGN